MRHIIRRLQDDEPVVREVLSKPQHLQNSFFDLKRREGIYEHNLKLFLEDKEPSMREQKLNFRDSLRVCTECKGFFSNRYFAKHKCKGESPEALKPKLMQKISDDKMDADEEFF